MVTIESLQIKINDLISYQKFKNIKHLMKHCYVGVVFAPFINRARLVPLLLVG